LCEKTTNQKKVILSFSMTTALLSGNTVTNDFSSIGGNVVSTPQAQQQQAQTFSLPSIMYQNNNNFTPGTNNNNKNIEPLVRLQQFTPTIQQPSMSSTSYLPSSTSQSFVLPTTVNTMTPSYTPQQQQQQQPSSQQQMLWDPKSIQTSERDSKSNVMAEVVTTNIPMDSTTTPTVTTTTTTNGEQKNEQGNNNASSPSSWWAKALKIFGIVVVAAVVIGGLWYGGRLLYRWWNSNSGNASDKNSGPHDIENPPLNKKDDYVDMAAKNATAATAALLARQHNHMYGNNAAITPPSPPLQPQPPLNNHHPIEEASDLSHLSHHMPVGTHGGGGGEKGKSTHSQPTSVVRPMTPIKDKVVSIHVPEEILNMPEKSSKNNHKQQDDDDDNDDDDDDGQDNVDTNLTNGDDDDDDDDDGTDTDTDTDSDEEEEEEEEDLSSAEPSPPSSSIRHDSSDAGGVTDEDIEEASSRIARRRKQYGMKKT